MPPLVPTVAIILMAAVLGGCTATSSSPSPSRASPTPTAAASDTHPSETTTPSPAATLSFRQITDALDVERLYLVNADGVPTGVHIDHTGLGNTASERIASRVNALLSLPCATMSPPPDLTCVVPSRVTTGAVTVRDDMASIDLVSATGQLGFGGEAPEWMFIQELVYTASEEPGITRVQLTVNGKSLAVPAGGTLGALSREDVAGYVSTGPVGADRGLDDSGLGAKSADTGLRYVSMKIEGARARLTFEGIGGDGHIAAVPTFKVTMIPAAARSTLGGKYVLSVESPIGVPAGGAGHVEFVNRTPIVSIGSGGTFTAIAVDDARPWRAYLTDPMHLVVEIGGHPHRVSASIAVSSPDRSGAVTRTFHLTGAARVFEADVYWKVVDDRQTVVAHGVTKASIGTSPLWGTFDTTITLPTTVPNGPVLPELRVYSVSMRDGSEIGIVAIPLSIR